MKPGIWWSIAFAMILLIITIPFYISDAYAANSRIDTISYSGAGNTTGFVMPTDTLTITAQLLASGAIASDVAKSVSVDFGGGPEQFSGCDPLGSDFYSCLFSKSYSEMEAGTYPATVTLSASGCVPSQCAKQISLSVDGVPPEFSDLTINPSKISSGNVTASYTATDTACPTCGSTCSGINKIRVYPSNDLSNLLAEINVSQSPNSPNNCLDSGSFSIPASKLPSGNYSVCIYGMDNAGNVDLTQGKCSPLIVAKDPPSVSTPVITDNYGNIITYVPRTGLPAKASAQVTSTYADLTNAIADLSAFNLPNQSMVCSNVAGERVWNCTAQFYLTIPSSSATQTLSVFTFDDAGNRGRNDFVYGLQADFTAPELASVKTNYMFRNFSFFGPRGNVLSLELAESQSGFHNNLTYAMGLEKYFDIYVPSGQSSPRYQAECAKSGNSWTCSWPAISLKSVVSGPASLSFEAYDDMNNKLEFSRQIPIDNEPPVINSVEMHTQNAYPAIGAGENLVIRANISENSAIVDSSGNYGVFMDLTRIEGGSGMRRADSCELKNETYLQGVVYNSSQWVCSWIVTGVKEENYWIPVINATDIAGNQKIYQDVPYDISALYVAYVSPKTGNLTYVPVQFFDILPTEEGITNYWKVTAGTSLPSALDKQILPVVSPYVYVPLVFSPVQGNPKILEITLEGCDNDGTASEINIFPNIPNSSNIELKIRNGNYGGKNSLRYACQIGTVSVAGGKITQKEIDNVTIGVGLYNMPLGKADKSVKDKLEGTYKEVTTDFAKMIGLLKQIYDWISQICSLYRLISSIVTTFHTISAIIHGDLEGCVLRIFCDPTSDELALIEDAVGGTMLGVNRYMEPFCQTAFCSPQGNVGGAVATWQSQYYKIKDRTEGVVAGYIGNLAKKSTSNENVGIVAEALTKQNYNFWPDKLTDSLFLSMVFICIPGVIYNLEKWRQIQCTYGSCVIQMAETGGPIKGCEDMKKVQECVAVQGEIFSVVPIISITKDLAKFMQTIFSDPVSLTFFVAGVLCMAKPSGEPLIAAIKSECRVANGITNAIDFVTSLAQQYQGVVDLINAGEDQFKNYDACQPFIDSYNDLK